MKYYLIETYSPNLKFECGDIIVALTPLASYELDKAGVKYSILEDYYDKAKFLKEEEDYFNDQIDWFNKFDHFLFSIYPEAKSKNLKLATTYYYGIKRMVDPLITSCKIIDFFINIVKPNVIIYVSSSWEEELINVNQFPLLFLGGQSLFSRIMPLFCEKYDIDFLRIILKEKICQDVVCLGYKNIPRRIKSSLKSNKRVRSLWHYYRTFNINDILLKFSKDLKYNLLFLKITGYNVIDIYKEVQKEGYGVFYKQDNKIIKNILYPKVVMNVCPDIISISKQDTTDYIKNIYKHKIISWINDYCNIDITNIIMPRLKYFVNEWCPQIIFLIDKYINFYNENQIDLVITPHMVLIDEFAAIIATRYSENTKSVCLQHGDEVFAFKYWDFIEYPSYDIYFAANYERELYVKHIVKLKSSSTKVFQYSNRYKILPKINKLKNSGGNKISQKTVVFVPAIYTWDTKRWSGIIPDAWYFKWHKKLINYFSSRKDFNFIWKGIPGSNHIYDPIPNLIDDRGYKNIRYATEPFVKWIGRADLVLLDFPSTALYEAAVSGVPVMSLSFHPLNFIRESALKLFGNSLEPINSFDEGIAKIDNFLNSNPDEFIVSIPYSKTSIVDTIKSFKENLEK
ncbi:hypothetical protein ES708_16778 [subsurface metagenome]